MTRDTLYIDDEDRYSRLRLIAWWDQDKLTAARVLVVGAGALGNEVLKNLALLGVGQVTVVDFDKIEDTNLTRSVLFRARDRGLSKAIAAAAAMADMNPDTHVDALDANIITEVGLGVFADADVVIGCLDNREARLWVNRCCWKVGTPWVDGGIQEINGVAKVFVPPDGACYECAMTENDYRLINLRYSCPLLRREDLLAGKVPTAPTIASMIGGLQTQEALKLIHGMPVDEGHALVFNGAANQFYKTRYPHREDCLSHDTWPTPIELPLSADNTAAELFAAAAPHFEEGTALELHLERDLILDLYCGKCDQRQRMMKAQLSVSMRDAACPTCGETGKPNMVHAVAANSPLVEEKLRSLGIPPYDIVRITSPTAEQVFLLAADRPARRPA
ncbi:HesA/MoeB/ThiF family protein [Lignipirellula cremea]|uniref:Sulfur carrier protein ThiS adenylyltransferase n=1 Tax=Lignipirellula cremea TaxID=2528010 RepID=A0A518DXY8_9BACT|nr:ThiF family adenylyltransferase [Lignipirellula cremea]QDU96710.1 Sulfur carrier protein ThiS adenylyltransferase [Lignipirellula cremea]